MTGTGPPTRDGQVLARGPDHPLLGAVAVQAVDDRLAGAVSAGSRAKDPPSHDPNEDGFLLRRQGGRVALLVVDGAGGFEAAAAVLGVVEAGLPSLLAAATLPAGASTLWRAALAARSALRRPAGDTRGRPHVAASLVVVEPDGRAWCTTTGDTAVVAVAPGRLRLLTGVLPHLDHQASLPQPQRVDLAPDEALVGVSDGFADALGEGWVSVVAAVTGSDGRGTAGARAARLVGAALAAGGPDHVTAVVHLPGGGARPGGAQRSRT